MKMKLTTTLCIAILFSVTVLSAMEEVDALERKEDEDCSDSLVACKSLLYCVETGEENSEFVDSVLDDIPEDLSKLLLRAGNNKLLLDGAYNGDLNEVRRLLSKKAEVDCQNEKGHTPLMRASHSGHLDMVALLVKNRADVNQGNKFSGTTALIKASFRGHSDVVRGLLDDRADVNLEDNHGWTALTEAAFAGNLETLRVLIAANADVNWQHKEGGTALMKASQEGYHEIVEKLIKSKANANMQNKKGRTALMKASRRGHYETAELLLGIGKADPRKKDNEGYTALEGVLRHHSSNALEGANLDKQDNEGGTVLMEAVEFANTSSKLLDLLIRSFLEADCTGAELLDGSGEVAHLFGASIGILLRAGRDIEKKKLCTKYLMALNAARKEENRKTLENKEDKREVYL